MKLLLIVLLLSSFVWGANKEGVTLSMRTYKQLSKVENLIAEKKIDEAGKKLHNMLAELPKSPVDRAYIFNSAANYYLLQNNYKKAIELFLKAYEQNAFGEQQMLQITEMIANLYMHNENYKEALSFYKRYLSQKPDAKKRIILSCAVSYYQLEQFREVITLLKKEIPRFEPDENLYRILFSSYYELKRQHEALQTVGKMVEYWSEKREYWLQLSALQYETEKIDKALQSIELAYNRGVLEKESDYMQYIYLLLEMQIPYKAATLLEKFLEKGYVKNSKRNQELLEHALIYAREKEAI